MNGARMKVRRLPTMTWRDVTEVLTSFHARLYGRRPARDRAENALRRASRDIGQARPAAAVAGDHDPECAERGPGS
jgi:hypothetical protein